MQFLQITAGETVKKVLTKTIKYGTVNTFIYLIWKAPDLCVQYVKGLILSQ